MTSQNPTFLQFPTLHYGNFQTNEAILKLFWNHDVLDQVAPLMTDPLPYISILFSPPLSLIAMILQT